MGQGMVETRKAQCCSAPRKVSITVSGLIDASLFRMSSTSAWASSQGVSKLSKMMIAL